MNMHKSLFNILTLYQKKSSKSTSFEIRMHLNWFLGKIKQINDDESFTDTILHDSCCCVLPVLTLFWKLEFYSRLVTNNSSRVYRGFAKSIYENSWKSAFRCFMAAYFHVIAH